MSETPETPTVHPPIPLTEIPPVDPFDILPPDPATLPPEGAGSTTGDGGEVPPIDGAEAGPDEVTVEPSETAVSGLQRALSAIRETARGFKRNRLDRKIERLDRKIGFNSYLGAVAISRLTGSTAPARVEPRNARERRAELDLDHNIFKRQLKESNERRNDRIFGARRGKINNKQTVRTRQQIIAEVRGGYEGGVITGPEAVEGVRGTAGVFEYSDNKTQRKARKQVVKAGEKVNKDASKPRQTTRAHRRLLRAQAKRAKWDARDAAAATATSPESPEGSEGFEVPITAGPGEVFDWATLPEIEPADPPEATTTPTPTRIPVTSHAKGELFGKGRKFYDAADAEALRAAIAAREAETEELRDRYRTAGLDPDDYVPRRVKSREGATAPPRGSERTHGGRPDLRVVSDESIRTAETSIYPSLERIDPEFQSLFIKSELDQLDVDIEKEISDWVHDEKRARGISELPEDEFSDESSRIRNDLIEEYVRDHYGDESLPPEIETLLRSTQRKISEARAKSRGPRRRR
ncbi:MAG: hypothetical protein ACXWLH_02230 [Candidatus Saccharimonadales bacterium]